MRLVSLKFSRRAAQLNLLARGQDTWPRASPLGYLHGYYLHCILIGISDIDINRLGMVIFAGAWSMLPIGQVLTMRRNITRHCLCFHCGTESAHESLSLATRHFDKAAMQVHTWCAHTPYIVSSIAFLNIYSLNIPLWFRCYTRLSFGLSVITGQIITELI